MVNFVPLKISNLVYLKSISFSIGRGDVGQGLHMYNGGSNF